MWFLAANLSRLSSSRAGSRELMSKVTFGDRGTHTARVTDEDTALRLGSGDLAVLATPRLVAWMEAAAVAALPALGAGMTSVGTHISVDHRAPTLVGAQVRALAEVRVVDGRQIEFEVSAFEDAQLIAAGTHARVVVDRQRFLARAGPGAD
jgi:predicted thioesterase